MWLMKPLSAYDWHTSHFHGFRQTEDISRKHLNVRNSFFSLCTETQPASPEVGFLTSWEIIRDREANWMQGKIINCLPTWKVLMGDKTDSLQRQFPNLSETRCCRQHLSACPASSLTGNGALDVQPYLLRQEVKAFMQHLLSLCLKSFHNSPCYALPRKDAEAYLLKPVLQFCYWQEKDWLQV